MHRQSPEPPLGPLGDTVPGAMVVVVVVGSRVVVVVKAGVVEVVGGGSVVVVVVQGWGVNRTKKGKILLVVKLIY